MDDHQIVRLGIAGSGRMARTRVANIAASPRARLIAVASHNQETGPALAAAQGCDYVESTEALLERQDLDAVVIATHNASHGALALAALRAGKHALVEYPLALDAGEAEAAVAEAERRGLALRVGYDQVWRGPHEAVRDLIRRDGPPLAAAARVAWPGGTRRSPFRNARVGGPPALVKSYYLYALLDWLGHPTASHGAVRYSGLAPDGHYDAAAQHVALEYPATLARVSWVVGPEGGGRQQIHIELTWPGHTVTGDGRGLIRRDQAGDTPIPTDQAPWAEATQRGLEHFLDAVAGNPPGPGDAALTTAVVRLGSRV